MPDVPPSALATVANLRIHKYDGTHLATQLASDWISAGGENATSVDLQNPSRLTGMLMQGTVTP